MGDIDERKKKLRSGFTTGACAAAAAKIAVQILFGTSNPEEAEIPLPTGARAAFKASETMRGARSATAGVVKDAGDDPDVTNGLTIMGQKFTHRLQPMQYQISGMDKSSSNSPSFAL